MGQSTSFIIARRVHRDVIVHTWPEAEEGDPAGSDVPSRKEVMEAMSYRMLWWHALRRRLDPGRSSRAKIIMTMDTDKKDQSWAQNTRWL
jgi:hypothetical protein